MTKRRYFFEVDECGVRTEDLVGMELTSIEAARDYATRAAREIMCGELANGKLCLACRMLIKDGDRALIETLPFRDLVTVVGLEGGL